MHKKVALGEGEGGNVQYPTYENHEGHAEVVEITYDPELTSFTKLLDFFFQIHDPTTLNQQGNDRGTSYRSVIFYADEAKHAEAQWFIQIVNDSKQWKGLVAPSLVPLFSFTKAEEYHQDYLQKYPAGYT